MDILISLLIFSFLLFGLSLDVCKVQFVVAVEALMVEVAF
jgi:hypothetical protein